MSAVAEAPAAAPTNVDPALLAAVQDAVAKGLTMCGIKARPVGVCTIPARDSAYVTGVIGVHGKVSGFITVGLGQRVAIKAVEGLLQDQFGTLTSQVVDGIGEITNIIVGGIKSKMASSPRAFSHITVPSVIVGTGYQMAYARGLEFLCCLFEHEDEEAVLLDDRLLQVSVSLLRL